jgi:ABC-2 type transport system permease protein
MNPSRVPRGRLVLEVARWEFARFVKWRQQLVGFVLTLAIGLGGSYAAKLIRGAGARPVTVAVVGGERLGFPLPTVEGVTWELGAATDVASAREAVSAERVRGALLVHAPDSAELVVRREGTWTGRIADALAASQRAGAFARLPLTDAQRASLDAPFALRTSLLGGAAGSGRSARVAALLFLFLGLTVLFSGFATLFAGITAEKQNRVTEQMVSMVTPQVWMDGKILGLLGVALVGAAVLVIGGVALLALVPRVLGSAPPALPPIAGDPGPLALIALINVLGTLMWFSFLAAVAATIDDPNSSARAMLLFVPMLPVGASFALVKAAESGVAQALAIFPLTSMAVLPVRLALAEVPWWEPVLSLALLTATAWFFRRAAGKVFAIAMLMHGKEPSLRELWRWTRERT